MKILVLDYLSPKNHSDLYNKIIKTLSKFSSVEVIAEKGYYNNYSIEWKNTKLTEYEIKKNQKNMISRKLTSLYSMLKTHTLMNNTKDHIKLVLTFDTVVFGIINIMTRNKNTFLLHHKNIDELESKVKKIIFKTYMNKVNHLVFEEEFKEYLVRTIGVEEKLINVIPHPSYNEKPDENSEPTIDCIGLSNSNDEDFIKSIIDYEKAYNFLRNSDMKVVLRSKKYSYDNGYLKIISGFLPQDEYENYVKKCKVMFIPLPKNFKHRVSGVMFDAFSNNKIVIANSTLLTKIYNEKYPNICIEASSEKDFFYKLYEIKSHVTGENDFRQLKKNHDENALLIGFTKVIEGVSTNES